MYKDKDNMEIYGNVDIYANALVARMPWLGNVDRIRVSKNQLESPTAFFKALPKLSGLQLLDLGSNRIGAPPNSNYR